MVKEKDLQAKIVQWLRHKGCFVWKCQQNATTQRGVADLFFCFEGFYGWIEVKKAKNAPRQLGQEQFITKMDNWSWARVVWPENWEETQKELEEILR